MNLTKYLTELDAIYEADPLGHWHGHRAAAIVGEVSDSMARAGHGELVRAPVPDVDVTDAKRYVSECIAATAEKQTADIERPFTVVQAAEVLGVSKEKVYALCDSGELACTRIGRRITIQRAVLERFQKLPAKSAVQYRHLR